MCRSKISANDKMKFKILILLCVSQAQVQGTSTTEGPPLKPLQPILNITSTTDQKRAHNNIAFFVSDSPNVPLCSGALIHYKWIVTVASRVKQYSFTELRFRYGGDLDVPGSSDHFTLGSLVYEIIPHPSYVESTRLNDIALVNTLENVPVQPYKITRTNPYILDLEVNLRGYGPLNTAAEKSTTAKLSEVSTELISTKQCQGYDSTVPNTKLCSTRGRICRGDQGGPLVLKSSTNVLIGIISVSISIDSLCDFGVTPIETYTNIFLFRQWIAQTLGLTNI